MVEVNKHAALLSVMQATQAGVVKHFKSARMGELVQIPELLIVTCTVRLLGLSFEISIKLLDTPASGAV